MKDDKIYEELNNIKVDIDEIDEIEVDEVTKKRFKKNVQMRIKKKSKNNKIKYLAAMALMILFLPASYEVISEVKKHFFYENGVGLVENTDKEVNNLKEPIVFGENDKYVLKNAVGTNQTLDLGVWVEKNENLKTEDIYIKTEDGEIINSSSVGQGSGGANNYLNLFFTTSKDIKTFELFIGNESVKVKLVEVDGTYEYNDVGSYDEKQGLILGGNKYQIKDKTYISFWNNLSIEYSNILVNDINKNDIVVRDKEGNILDINSSAYNGMQTEFVLDKKYDETLNVSINRIELGYQFEKESNKDLELPKENTKNLVNQNLELEHFGTVNVVSIEDRDGTINVELDVSEMNKNSIEISLLSMIRNGASAVGSDGKSNCIISIDKADLTIKEKLSNKLELEINEVDFYINNTWNFNIN